MVVRLPDHDETLLIEANSRGEVNDFFAGQCLAGVTLVAFHERVACYDGRVALRRRDRALSARAAERFRRRVRQYYRRPYKNFVLSMTMDLLLGLHGRAILPGVFCSELVAELCRHMGWLVGSARTSRVVPAHFHETEPRAACFAHAGFGSLEWLKASDAPACGTPAIVPETAVHETPLPRQ